MQSAVTTTICPSSAAGGAAKTAPPKPAEPLPIFIPPVAHYDAIATLDAIGTDGSVAHIVAVREPSGRMRLRRQELGAARPIEVVLEGTGAQVALVDLDLDGSPELVTTNDGADDGIVVSSFAKGAVTARLRFPAKEPVRALGVCPPEDKGVPAVVAVVGNEVWLVR